MGNYDLSERWMLSGAFVFNTGRPYTLPVGVDVGNGGTLYNGTYAYYTERNNYRLNNFHRLDVSAIYKKQGEYFIKATNLNGFLVFIIFIAAEIHILSISVLTT